MIRRARRRWGMRGKLLDSFPGRLLKADGMILVCQLTDLCVCWTGGTGPSPNSLSCSIDRLARLAARDAGDKCHSSSQWQRLTSHPYMMCSSGWEAGAKSDWHDDMDPSCRATPQPKSLS